MHVIRYKTVRAFYEEHAAAKPYLTACFKTTWKAEWSTLNELRNDFPSAELVVDGKVVFNIKANDFQLVALVGFRSKKVFLLWIGAHAQCDKMALSLEMIRNLHRELRFPLEVLIAKSS